MATNESSVGDELEVRFREARLSDADSLFAMCPGLYNGADYLPAEFDVVMRQAANTCYVLEALHGPAGSTGPTLVSFIWCFLLDRGRRVAFGAARTHPAFRRRGLFTRLKRLAVVHFAALHPNVGFVIWAAHHRSLELAGLEAAWQAVGAQLLLTRFVQVLHGALTAGEVQRFQRTFAPTGEWQSSEQAQAVLSSAEARGLLGGRSVFSWNQPCFAEGADVGMAMGRYGYCLVAREGAAGEPAGISAVAVGSIMAVPLGLRLDFMHFGPPQLLLPMFARLLDRLPPSCPHLLFLMHAGNNHDGAHQFFHAVQLAFPELRHMEINGDVAVVVEQPISCFLAENSTAKCGEQ